MKLTAVLAMTMSVLGCAADNDGEGGAALVGLRPAKPAPDDPTGQAIKVEPAIRHVLESGVPTAGQDAIRTPDGGDVSVDAVSVPFPIDGLCVACDDVIVLRDARDPSTLHVIDDHGQIFCRIWVANDGHLLSTDCR